MRNRCQTTAVLDVGKTNVKVCLVDGSGEIFALRSRPNQLGAEPYPHFEVDELFDWMLGELRNLARLADITALVTTTHGAAVAALSGDELALPVLDYEFAGPSELDAEYDAQARDFAHTFSPSLPVGLNLGRQLFWLERKFSAEFARVTDLLLYPQYFAWRLCGRKCREVTSLGCHTDLYAPLESAFSRFAVLRGYDRLFPELVPAWCELGVVRPELAAQIGLSGACCVHAGIHDSNASYLTHRLRYPRENRFSVVSTGTWILCMSSSSSLETLEEQKDTLANVDAFGAPVACSRFMGGREFEILAGAEGTKIAVEQADIEALLARGALALPCFASSGGPFRDRPGRIVGLEDDGVRSRAALATLYSALMTDYCLDLIRVDGDCIIEGSFTQNRAYCSLLAALRPSQRVLVSTDTTGTVRGTALLSNLSSEGSPKPENPFEPVAPLVIDALGQYQRRWRTAAEGA